MERELCELRTDLEHCYIIALGLSQVARQSVGHNQFADMSVVCKFVRNALDRLKLVESPQSLLPPT
jgi:hypothetical protein